MKKTVGFIVSLLIIFFAEIIIQKYFGLKYLKPNLTISYIIFVALYLGHLQSTLYGFLCGMVYDVINLVLFGQNTLIFMTIGYLSGWLFKKVDESLLKVQIIMLLVSSYFYFFLVFLLPKIFNYTFSFSYYFMLLPLIDTFFGILFIKIFIFIYKKLEII